MIGLGLPVVPKDDAGNSGLAFEFLEDSTDGDAKRVLTGHDNGLITINIAEADDVHREQQRTLQKEPYRTLLGHFRHEIGHYFWDRLVAEGPNLPAFRELFGDERADYQKALDRHYGEGSAGELGREIHQRVRDHASLGRLGGILGTLSAHGRCARDRRRHGFGAAAQTPRRAAHAAAARSAQSQPPEFRPMIESWLSLTYVLNNLSRGLGLPDSYPFVLSAPAIAKLRFIHDIINENRTRPGESGGEVAIHSVAVTGEP